LKVLEKFSDGSDSEDGGKTGVGKGLNVQLSKIPDTEL
jgi:hypothetical protein